MSNRLIPLLFAALAVAIPAAADVSGDPVAKGEAVAREWDSRDRGFGDSRVALTMVLENRRGQTSERRLRIDTLEVDAPGRGDKSLVVFDHPGDIKGTALLSFARILEPDDQWLFLPALKRVKRISSANKSGPFVGSEFAYEDITGQEFGKYAYRWLRDEPYDGVDCYVVERRPRYERSGYTRLVTWYDKAAYRVRRVDYYDRKNQLLKTLTASDFRQYLDKYWRAHSLLMDNHQTGKKTRLTYGPYRMRTGLKDSDFTRRRLGRAR